MTISDKLKKAMFNGRVNNGAFRRGLWSVDELEKADLKNKPIIPTIADADGKPLKSKIVKIFWYNGCLALAITDDKKIIVNSDVKTDDITNELIGLFKGANKGATIGQAPMGKPVHKGASRDWDAVFAL